MDGTNLTTNAIGYLAAAALAIGLVGAGVSACDLTQPSFFQRDSMRRADSTDTQAGLTGGELDVAVRDLPLRIADASRG